MEPMLIWSASIAALAVFIVAIVLRRRSRGLAGQLRRLTARVGGLTRVRNNPETFDLLRRIFALAHAAIAAGDEASAYRAVELVKTVYGHGVARPDEAELLAALATRAIRAKQPDIAAAALDAARHLLKQLPAAALPAAVDKLTGITAAALRDRHNFLAAKAADIIFGLLERADWARDEAAVRSALQVLRMVGVLVLRRRDGDLFREMLTRLAAVTPARVSGSPAAELVALLGAWLHRIVRNDDPAMFAPLAQFVTRRGEDGLWPDTELAALVREWHHLAGTASLRPGSTLAPAIAETALRLGLVPTDAKRWEAAVAAAGQTARMAVQRHGLPGGFPLVLPLLEVGRELLALELKFGAADSATFRQQALYLLVRECLALAEFAARQDMVSTAGDVIADFLRLWNEAGRANPKAAKRFCQLLAAHWLRSGSRRAKRAAVSDELAKPALLTETDKQRLGFLS